MLVGILLFLDFISDRPSLIVFFNFLVSDIIIKFSGKLSSFFSWIWFDEIKIDPSPAIKFSQSVTKHFASSKLDLNSVLSL